MTHNDLKGRQVPMNQMCIVVANDPRAYRDVIGAALQALYPSAVVVTTDPADLDRTVVQRQPQIVVCSRLTETVQTRVGAWVLLYPDGDAHAVISIAGQQTTVPGLEFDGLLTLIDRTAGLRS